MYNRLSRISRLITLALISWLPVTGHAILLSTAPASKEIVRGPTVLVKLRFNSRIDIKRSRLILVPHGNRERLLIVSQPSPDTVTSHVNDMSPGSYVLRWQVLAEDGHITRGELPFQAR